jgi:hypothetical protein
MEPLHGIKVLEFAALGPTPMGAMMYTLKAMGQWTSERGSNLLDGGAL